MGRNKTSNLVPYNSKVAPEVAAITNALVKTQANGCKSQHDLIKDMLRLYEENYPQEFVKARAYVELMAGSEKIYEKEEGGK